MLNDWRNDALINEALHAFAAQVKVEFVSVEGGSVPKLLPDGEIFLLIPHVERLAAFVACNFLQPTSPHFRRE